MMRTVRCTYIGLVPGCAGLVDRGGWICGGKVRLGPGVAAAVRWPDVEAIEGAESGECGEAAKT